MGRKRKRYTPEQIVAKLREFETLQAQGKTAAEAIRERFGSDAWADAIADRERRSVDQPSIWHPDDLSRRPYAVNYKKAPLALHALAERIGDEAMERLVVDYMTGPLDDTPALLDALEAQSGRETRRWFEGRLAEAG